MSLWRREQQLILVSAVQRMALTNAATFDAALRFLDENPWDRLRIIKQHCPKTPLQMLLRGQNLVGYRHYSDDIVRRFVLASKRNGIDVFRVFDALNDIRNVEVSARAIKECGGHFEGAISYTVSPVHTLDGYVAYAREQVRLAEIEHLLATNTFLPQVQAQLGAIDAGLRELGYDPEAHEAARQAELRGRQADAAKIKETVSLACCGIAT